jgi:phosphoribosylanthranilate isomerase
VTKVKICGFTDPRDVRVACGLGIDMVGAVLIPGSPRALIRGRAREVLDATYGDVAKVALVSPDRPGDLDKFANELGADYLQFHLNLKFDEVKKARKRLDVGFIVVVSVPRRVEDRRSVLQNAQSVSEVADIVLVDTEGLSGGGTGLTHDWNISREIRRRVDKPVFLAGGLDPSNVSDAIKTVKPDGVDVASGVESDIGKKDRKLMEDFVEAVKGIRTRRHQRSQ